MRAIQALGDAIIRAWWWLVRTHQGVLVSRRRMHLWERIYRETGVLLSDEEMADILPVEDALAIEWRLGGYRLVAERVAERASQRVKKAYHM